MKFLVLFISSWELLYIPPEDPKKVPTHLQHNPWDGDMLIVPNQDGVNGLWTEKEMTVEAVIEEAGANGFLDLCEEDERI